MPHTFPEDFIPLADAFEQAVNASMLCKTSAVRCIETTAPALAEANGGPPKEPVPSAKKGPTRKPNAFEKYDETERQIERLMREAIVDDRLPVFCRGPNGQIEKLVDRKKFKEPSFGAPGFENVPHHLISPGEDTGHQPALLKKSDFENWLRAQRDKLDPFYTGAPGKPSAIKLVKHEHQRRLSSGEALEKVGQEAAHLKKRLDENYPDAPNTTAKTIENAIREAHRHARGNAA
jgi:hypothetical protein